jgi:hypothetical protein
MTLQAQLDAFKADFEAGRPPYSVPASVITIMHRATAELEASGLAEHAKRTGEAAPCFTLKDAEGHSVSSVMLLAHGPRLHATARTAGNSAPSQENRHRGSRFKPEF